MPGDFAVVEQGRLRFVISSAPRPEDLAGWVAEMKRERVRHVVRACEPTCDETELARAGLVVHDAQSTDGDVPDKQTLKVWLEVVRTVFGTPKAPSSSAGEGDTVACFCVAGLGRSPLLVAIALLEFGCLGGDPLAVVSFVRSSRKNAINLPQLKWLQSYKPLFKQHPGCALC